MSSTFGDMAKMRHPEREMRGDSQGRQSFMRTEADCVTKGRFRGGAGRV